MAFSLTALAHSQIYTYKILWNQVSFFKASVILIMPNILNHNTID